MGNQSMDKRNSIRFRKWNSIIKSNRNAKNEKFYKKRQLKFI